MTPCSLVDTNVSDDPAVSVFRVPAFMNYDDSRWTHHHIRKRPILDTIFRHPASLRSGFTIFSCLCLSHTHTHTHTHTHSLFPYPDQNVDNFSFLHARYISRLSHKTHSHHTGWADLTCKFLSGMLKHETPRFSTSGVLCR
jgi:hypothetical protein